MKSYKNLMNSLSEDNHLRVLSDEEMKKLREVFLISFSDLKKCCDRHGLTVMMIGGSALGTVRHEGFIPWDDDLDVAMSRADFETLKKVFQKELGDRYVLTSPNYDGNARNRFPQLLIKNTRFVEAGADPNTNLNMIKIDIFIIEGVPENILLRFIKGINCSVLMGIASYVDSYQNKNKVIKEYMCKTPEGKRAYLYRMFLGKLFSFRRAQKWYDILDIAMQYNKKSNLAGIPSGRKHYFGEIRSRSTFFPTSEGRFEGMSVDLPGNPKDYLMNLYGSNYMQLPPPEKREKHFILDVEFEAGEDTK